MKIIDIVRKEFKQKVDNKEIFIKDVADFINKKHKKNTTSLPQQLGEFKNGKKPIGLDRLEDILEFMDTTIEEIIISDRDDILIKFRNKKLIKEINSILFKVENINPSGLYEIFRYMKFVFIEYNQRLKSHSESKRGYKKKAI